MQCALWYDIFVIGLQDKEEDVYLTEYFLVVEQIYKHRRVSFCVSVCHKFFKVNAVNFLIFYI